MTLPLAQRLNSVLMSRTIGQATQIASSTGSSNWPEALYQLARRHAQTKAHGTLTSMRKLLHMKTTDDDEGDEEHIRNWERQATQLEVAGGQKKQRWPSVAACLPASREAPWATCA